MASSLVVRIGADIRAFEQRINQAENRMKRFSYKMERIGRDLTTRVSAPIIGIGVAAVSTFAKFDRMEKALQAVAGSAKAGSDQFDRLFKIVNDPKTTLDLKGSATAAIQLQAVGQSARQTENLLRQLGIAATVSGSSADDVGEVGRQLAQAAAKGNILQQELRIILERIPALAAVIKDEFGTVTAEGLREAGVSADDFLARLTGAIEGNEKFQNVQASLAKSFESFQANLQQAGAEVGKVIAETFNLQENLERLAAFANRVAEGFKNLNPATQKFIVYAAGAAAAVGPLALGMGAVARSLPLLRSGLSVLLGPIGKVVSSVAKLTSTASLFLTGGSIARAVLLTKALTGIKAAIAVLTGPIGLIVAAVGLLTAGFVSAYRNSEFFRLQLARVSQAFLPITDAISRLIQKVLPDFSFSLSGIGSVFNTVIAGISAGISFIVEGFIAVVDTVKFVGGAISDIFDGNFSGAADKLGKTLFNPVVLARTAAESANAAATVFNQTLDGKINNVAIGNVISRGGDDNAGAETGAAAGAGEGLRRNVQPVQPIDSETLGLLEVYGLKLRESAVNAEFLQSKIEGLKVTVQEDPFKAYRDGLEIVNEKQNVFGESYDGLTEKINLTKGAITALIEEGYTAQSGAIELLTEQLTGLLDTQNQQKEAIDAQTAAADKLKEALALMGSVSNSAFGKVESAMARGAGAAKAFGSAVVSSIREAISAELKLAVATQVGKALKSVPFPFNIGVAAAAGAGASALFNGALNALKIPALAEGGLAVGPTLALIGEGREREAVLPLSKLQGLLDFSGGGTGGGEFVLRGEDMVLLMERATGSQKRIS